MTLQQWLIAAAIGIAVGVVFKVAPILIKGYQNKGLTDAEKEQLQDIIIVTIRQMLTLSTIKSQDQLIVFAVDRIKEELAAENISGFTDDEITTAVKLAVNALTNQLNNNAKYANHQYVGTVVAQLKDDYKVE